MKIIKVNRQAGCWPAEAAEALKPGCDSAMSPLPVSLLADSATNRNDRPVFIPDFAREGWVMEVLPAVHIGHQGKFIAPRFAGRYVSGISLVALLRPASGEWPAMAGALDCALTLGPAEGGYPKGSEVLNIEASFAPLPNCAEPFEEVAAGVEITGDDLRIDETVALLSRYCTLKTGDIILPASVGLEFPVRLDAGLRAGIPGCQPLITRLK